MPTEEDNYQCGTGGTLAPDLYNTLKFESNRLQTFREWPESETGITGKRLANAGLYYTGDQTTVHCFECGANIDHWSADDVPLVKHRQLYPNCKFVEGISDNIPLVNGTGGSVTEQSVNGSSDSQVNQIPVSEDSGNSTGSSPLSSSPPNMTSSSSTGSASSPGSGDETEVNANSSEHIINNRLENMIEFRRLMKTESNRLKTYFINGQCLWPVPGIRPEELARAGLYYVQDDQVQCAFCTGLIKSWRPGLRALEEHSKHFPLCPYLMEEDVGNIPIGLDPIRDPSAVVGQDVCGSRHMSPEEEIGGQVVNTRVCTNSVQSQAIDCQTLGIQLYSGPKHPEMGPLESRKKSFRDLAWDPRVPVSVDSLAEAGFYYVGTGDSVICFHCDGGLCEWEQGDDPWIEHAKKFPNCNFLKLNKSQSFIDECKQSEQLSDEELHPTNSDDVMACRVVEHWMSSDLVQQLIAINSFSTDLIKAALNRRYYTTKQMFDSFAQLYTAVSELSDSHPNSISLGEGLNVRQSVGPSVPITSNNSQSVPTQQSNSEQTANNLITSVSSTQRPITTSTSSATAPVAPQQPNSTEMSVIKGSERGENSSEIRLMCKICYLSEIEVVFLPCGHQLACSQCAQRLTDCPVCRQPIKGFVRTFFS